MLKIGDFSKLSRVSIRMLRHYDELGLLVPSYTDSFTGYRYYSESQLPAAGRVASLKSMGFSLAMIREILPVYEDTQLLTQYLRVKHSETQEQADALDQRLRFLETAMEQMRKDGIVMNYDVTLKTLPERYVASVRQVIPTYDQEGLLWKILMEETAPLNLQDGNPCYTLAIFHDGEHKEFDVDVEVQKSVRGTYANTKNVIFKTVPPVAIASATYTGSYEKINEVNEAVAQWVTDNGYNFNGLSFLIYHVSPYETQNPAEYVTEVCYPVVKK